MTLEAKLAVIAGKEWTPRMAIDCWTQYHALYENKYHGALFAAIKGGNVEQYIQRECKLFVRYARIFLYKHRRDDA